MSKPMIAPRGLLQGGTQLWQKDYQRFHLHNIGASPACTITALFLHVAQPGCFVYRGEHPLSTYASMPIECLYTTHLPRFPAKFPSVEKILTHMWYTHSYGRLTLFYTHPSGEKHGVIYEYTEQTWHHAATLSHISWDLDIF
jgi:hypothetical protein